MNLQKKKVKNKKLYRRKNGIEITLDHSCRNLDEFHQEKEREALMKNAEERSGFFSSA